MENNMYFRMKEEHRHINGFRFFMLPAGAFADSKLNITMICIDHGDRYSNRGRGHNVGIYTIASHTFMYTYFKRDLLDKCTEQEYQKEFEAMVNRLKE